MYMGIYFTLARHKIRCNVLGCAKLDGELEVFLLGSRPLMISTVQLNYTPALSASLIIIGE